MGVSHQADRQSICAALLVPGKRAGLSSRGLARLLRVDNRTLRRWRKGTRPDRGHLIALFNLAAEMGLLHILLTAVGELGAVERQIG